MPCLAKDHEVRDVLRLGNVLELQNDRVHVSDEEVMHKGHACGDFEGVFGYLGDLARVVRD